MDSHEWEGNDILWLEASWNLENKLGKTLIWNKVKPKRVALSL